MTQLHLGRGATHGPLTVFPIWGPATRGRGYSTDARRLDVTECEDGPTVNALAVTNPEAKPVLVLEGQLFEGGWQHRMALHSTLVGAHQRLAMPVACVEQGRWGGDGGQRSRGRRAAPSVRDATRPRHEHDGPATPFAGDHGTDGWGSHGMQRAVWSRVAAHTRGPAGPGHAGNATDSLVQHLDTLAPLPRDAFAPLPGQVGVLVGIGGEPYLAEVFDSPVTLRRQLRAVLDAARVDARAVTAVATPGRRARRFLARAEGLRVQPDGDAGVGARTRAVSEHVDITTLHWSSRDLHRSVLNLRHPVLAAA